jgi:Chaperone of endosialidase
VGTTGADIIFQVGNNGATEAMRVLNSGNVGIGTTTPGYPLQVRTTSTTNANTISMVNEATQNVSALSWVQAGSNTLAYTSIYGDGRTTGYMAFRTNDTERMRIDTAGNVGIGTTTPDARLHVLDTSAGGAVWGHFANSSGAANSTAVISLDPGNNGVNTRDAQIRGVNNGANQIVMSFWTSNAAAPVERMRIDTNGDLLVGTGSAAGTAATRCYMAKAGGTTWQVGPATTGTGNSFYVINSSDVGVVLNTGNTAWTANSDERLKDIIEPIENAAEKVSSLRAVIGKYKTDSDGTRRPS